MSDTRASITFSRVHRVWWFRGERNHTLYIRCTRENTRPLSLPVAVWPNGRTQFVARHSTSERTGVRLKLPPPLVTSCFFVRSRLSSVPLLPTRRANRLPSPLFSPELVHPARALPSLPTFRLLAFFFILTAF